MPESKVGITSSFRYKKDKMRGNDVVGKMPLSHQQSYVKKCVIKAKYPEVR
jgi:hypothetical protein